MDMSACWFCSTSRRGILLRLVDAYSKWPEIFQMNSITTSATIDVMKKIFAQFGNPQTLVTGNGTQFTSSSLKDFCKSSGITHVFSPPFHPQSNRQAEQLDALQTFLMAYRSTPCPSGPNHRTPAENFFGRQMRTTLDLLRPSKESHTGTRAVRMEKQFNQPHGARRRQFNVSDAVYVKDYRGQKTTWIPGIVVRRTESCTYVIRCEGLRWTRFINQLRSRFDSTILNYMLDVFELPLFSSDNSTLQNSPSPTATGVPAQDSLPPSASSTTTRRSSRSRRAPKRLVVNPKKKTYT